MAKLTPAVTPDPMEREVDRLLAQLERYGRPVWTPNGTRAAESPGAQAPIQIADPPTPRDLAHGAEPATARRSGPFPPPSTMPAPIRPLRSSGRFPGESSPRATQRWPTRDRVYLWSRLLLGIALGVLMTQWPYAHGCGWPLLGYGFAVGTLMVTGGWLALDSWKQRNGLAHLLSLMLFWWGTVLAAEQVLPRIGYTPDRASWVC
jgi:hypothetical protein